MLIEKSNKGYWVFDKYNYIEIAKYENLDKWDIGELIDKVLKDRGYDINFNNSIGPFNQGEVLYYELDSNIELEVVHFNREDGTINLIIKNIDSFEMISNIMRYSLICDSIRESLLILKEGGIEYEYV